MVIRGGPHIRTTNARPGDGGRTMGRVAGWVKGDVDATKITSIPCVDSVCFL